MNRNAFLVQLIALIDTARAEDKTHISLHLQDDKLEIRSHPLDQFAAVDHETLASSYPVIKVDHSQQVVWRVSTGEHEVPANVADNIRVAQALLDDLEEHLSEPLFVKLLL